MYGYDVIVLGVGLYRLIKALSRYPERRRGGNLCVKGERTLVLNGLLLARSGERVVEIYAEILYSRRKLRL